MGIRIAKQKLDGGVSLVNPASPLLFLCPPPELNKTKRKLLDPPSVKPAYLEGGASGRLPRIMAVDGARSGCW